MQDVKSAKIGFGTSISRVQRLATPADFNLIVIKNRGFKILSDLTISNTEQSVIVRAEDYVLAGRVLVFEGEFNPDGDWFASFDPIQAVFDVGALRKFGVNNLLRDFIVWGQNTKHYRFGEKGLKTGTSDVALSILATPFYLTGDTPALPTGGRSVICANGFIQLPYGDERRRIDLR